MVFSPFGFASPHSSDRWAPGPGFARFTAGSSLPAEALRMRSHQYKGFTIMARSYQLRDSKRWTAGLAIRRHRRWQPFTLSTRYATQEEADAESCRLGRSIIDGSIPGWTVDHMRASFWSSSTAVHRWTDGARWRYLVTGLVIATVIVLLLLLAGPPG